MTVVFGRLFRAVMAAIWSLLVLVACSKTDDAWQTAVRTDTPDAYEAFLERNPASQYAAQARARRDALIDERDWSVARRENTAESYARYLEVHPEGVWNELATERRERLAPKVETAVVVPVAPPVAAPIPAPGPALAPAPAIAPSPKYYLQLGAFSSATAARQSWGRLQRSFVELAELKPLIDDKPLRGSSLYRLRVAVVTQEDADRVCAALVRGGADCIKSKAL